MYLLFGWQGARHHFPEYSTRLAIRWLWVVNLLRRGVSPPQIGPEEFRQPRANIVRLWVSRLLRKIAKPYPTTSSRRQRLERKR